MIVKKMDAKKNNPEVLKPAHIINNQINVDTGSGGASSSSC